MVVVNTTTTAPVSLKFKSLNVNMLIGRFFHSLIYDIFYQFISTSERNQLMYELWGRRGHDRREVGFMQLVHITTNVVSSNPAQARCLDTT